jgi:hypothetical protein
MLENIKLQNIVGQIHEFALLYDCNLIIMLFAKN